MADIQNFSATGRPYKAPTKAEKHGNAMNSISTAESWGAGPPNLLPVRYTDESLISVPVLRPEDVGRAEPQKATKKSLFSSRRKSTNENFVIKQIPRGEYLKHYAKDDNGRYCGTEAPANDCILRGDDVGKYRGHLHHYRGEIDNLSNADTMVNGKDFKDKDDGFIR